LGIDSLEYIGAWMTKYACNIPLVLVQVDV